VTESGQLSVKFGLEYETFAPQNETSLLTKISERQEETGSSLSRTSTTNEQERLFPEKSITRYETFVTPKGKIDPLVSPCEMLKYCTPQLSEKEGGAYVTSALQTPGSVFTTIDAGQVIAGRSISMTLTSNEQYEECPTKSVVTKVTFV